MQHPEKEKDDTPYPKNTHMQFYKRIENETNMVFDTEKQNHVARGLKYNLHYNKKPGSKH
jgi:hypothetical protein